MGRENTCVSRAAGEAETTTAAVMVIMERERSVEDENMLERSVR
jgi:hypothetical protein